jgi:dihydrofolate reductase
MKKDITLIAAASENHTLGKDNQLIWYIPEDLKRFKRLTQGHAVIMGRKTFESLPKALPNRKNIILTHNPNYRAEGGVVVHSIEEALKAAADDPQPFIIGGGEIYSLFLPIAQTIELTRVHAMFDGDAFFPNLNPDQWEIVQEENFPATEDLSYAYSYITYKNKTE